MKIARKFTLALVVGILVVLTASVVVQVNRELRLFKIDIARDARVLGRALGHAVERAWETNGEEEALELVRHSTRQQDHLQIRWVWLDAASGDEYSAVAPTGLLEPLYHGESVVLSLGEAPGTLYTYVPVRASTDRVGAIEIGDPLVDERAYLHKSILHASIAALVLVILCALLTWVLGVALIGRPMKRLVDHARAIGLGDLDRRLDLDAQDEIGELASEMNAMSARLFRARKSLQHETRSRLAAIEQLRHADRLATVGTLASGVAHELGTPINVIDGYAQLIREDSSTAGPSRDAAVIIGDQCKRMTSIIRQLLDFAREGGAKTGSTDLRDVMRETLKMVDPLMRKKNIELRVQEPTYELRVGVDFGRMQQVVANVVVNAVHAMPEGGQLSVWADHQVAARASDGVTERGFVILSIEDDGIGMDQETVARIFEPFFTTKDVGEGTGLGLSVAYGIVEGHGGWIEVQSEPRHGSVFKIFLPSDLHS